MFNMFNKLCTLKFILQVKVKTNLLYITQLSMFNSGIYTYIIVNI